MKYFIEKCEQSKHGYRLVEVDSTGAEKIYELNSKTTDNYLRMPEAVAEATNRRLVSMAMIEKSGQARFEVEWREAKVKGTAVAKAKKSIEDYLTGDDLEQYKALVAKAERAMKIEALKAEIEAQKAVLAELEK